MWLGAAEIDGYWKSQGYGYVFAIHGPVLDAYEVTATTCVRGFTAHRTTAAPPAFRMIDGPTYTIKAANDADHIIVGTGALADISPDRVAGLPDVCRQLTPTTPLGNLEVFSRTWSEHYIAFDQRHVDWDAVVAAERQRITDKTPPVPLFAELESMIKPLGDMHVGISAPRLKRETPGYFRPGTDRVIRGGIGLANGPVTDDLRRTIAAVRNQ